MQTATVPHYPKYFFYFTFRYEDEINKRTECENDFVLIKKVSDCLDEQIENSSLPVEM